VPGLPAYGGHQPAGHRFSRPDWSRPRSSTSQAVWTGIGGVLGAQPSRSGDVPEQWVQLAGQFVQGGAVASSGLFEQGSGCHPPIVRPGIDVAVRRVG
jgi:hypothetical protein